MIRRWTPRSKGAAVEQFLPILVAIVGTCFLWLRFVPVGKRLEVAYELASPLVSVMAIAVGFIAASLTILVTGGTRPILKLRENKQGYGRLVRYHAWATYLGIAACGTSLLILARKHDVGPLNVGWFDAAWFLINAWAGAAFIRVLVILVALLHPKED